MQFLVLAASALAASHIIQASDYKYEPAYLEIQAGDTVTWEGLEGHDVVQSKTANSCSRLASGFKFNPSTAVDVQFNTPGDFDYFCSVGFGTHCRMVI